MDNKTLAVIEEEQQVETLISQMLPPLDCVETATAVLELDFQHRI